MRKIVKVANFEKKWWASGLQKRTLKIVKNGLKTPILGCFSLFFVVFRYLQFVVDTFLVKMCIVEELS